MGYIFFIDTSGVRAYLEMRCSSQRSCVVLQI